MNSINISKEDYEFLKDLQHELKTQDNDGTAQPLYWGVMDYHDELTWEGDGQPRITTDDEPMTLDEAVEMVNEDIEDYPEEVQEVWKDVDKEDADDVAYFMREVLDWDFSEVYWVEQKGRIANGFGAFLTKRACQEYLKKYGYNHSPKAHTYAMCAFRNFELERLLNILKTMDFGNEGK